MRQENSIAWLLNFLLDKLRESAPAENIGAAIVLAHLLPDTHQRVPEVQHFLSRVSESYLNAVIDSFLGRAQDHDRVDVPKWMTSVLLELLIKPNWTELGSEVISRTAWLLRNKAAERALYSTVLDCRFAPLLTLLLQPWHERPTDEAVVIGNFRFTLPKFSDRIDDSYRAIDGEALNDDALGIFNFIQLLLRFSRTPLPPRCTARSSCRFTKRAMAYSYRLRRVLRFPMPKVPTSSTLSEEAVRISSRG